MFNHIVLDIAIGIVFVFLVYSLLASAINEIIASAIKTRGRMLIRGVQRMLNGESIYWWHNLEKIINKIFRKGKLTARHRRMQHSLAELFKQHTMFKRLAKNNKPTYISASKFSDILLDILHQQSKTTTKQELDSNELFEPRTFTSVRTGLNNILNDLETKVNNKDCPGKDLNCYQVRKEELFEIFSVLLDQANGDLLRLKKLIEQWFDETMDRVSGWYKRQTFQVLFVIGLVLTVLFNVDAIAIINTLSTDKTARETLVGMAGNYIQQHPKPDTIYKLSATGVPLKDSVAGFDSTQYKFADSVIRKVYKDAKKNVDSVNTLLGLGWGDYGFAARLKKDPAAERPGFFGKIGHVIKEIFSSWRKLFGLLITSLAIALGGPFWFDILSKLVNLRMSGKKPVPATGATSAVTNSQPANPAATDQKPLPGSAG